MFNLDFSNNQIPEMAIIEALVIGVIWGFLIYIVIKRSNKTFFVQYAENKWHGIYGGIAAALIVITKNFFMELINNTLLWSLLWSLIAFNL